MIKVLHLDTGRLFRGGQEQVYLHLKHLGAFEVKQYLACPETSRLKQRGTEYMSGYFPLAESNLGRILKRRELTGYIRRNGIQIVHAHDSHAHSLAIFLQRAQPEIRVVVTRRSSGRIGWGSRTKYRWHGIVFIAISETVRRDLREGGVNDSEIALIPSMIDLNEIRSHSGIRTDNASFSGEINLISVGALDKEKGFIDAVKAVKRLMENKPSLDLKYILVGDGPEKRKVSSFISRNGLADKVNMIGWSDEPSSFLQKGSIYLAPSHREGLGIGLLKAMGAGMAVVASDISAHRELVEEGQTGFLFPCGDFDAMADKIAQVLENQSLREKVSQNAENTAAKYDAAVISEKIYRLYYKICPHR
ncbi:MAG: glycosyltransferase family 4 protein [bacterium]|jgi:glycosyltransferase involved in cell wall biosynthesis